MCYNDKMRKMEDRPLIIQTDKSLLLEVDSPAFEACRDQISPFAELIRSPEHIHTYQISGISIWNALGAGLTLENILDTLRRWTKFPIPQIVVSYITETARRFGRLVLTKEDENTLCLTAADEALFREIRANKHLCGLFSGSDSARRALFLSPLQRGNIKAQLIRLDYPVEDLIPFEVQQDFPVSLKPELKLRDYQVSAVRSVLGNGEPGTGYGVVVLPCGSGKTIVGMAIMAALCTPTLIICPNVIAVRQWIAELKDKTQIPPEEIGEYSGEKKQIRNITVCTYQVLIYQSENPDQEQQAQMNHLSILGARPWGLVIFDEVHLLPAPMFRFTASIQTAHRVGMTATLIREDGLERDVFSLIGPKRCDVPWSVLEQKGWIAQALCTEVRVPLSEQDTLAYAIGSRYEKNRIAAVNPLKIDVVLELIKRHKDEFILIIGHYISQLRQIGQYVDCPVITGSMPNREREKYFEDFRQGRTHILIVSRVANFAVDLPDASVAIQVSGIFGSRQEEAQRLGRILRPKERHSSFYSVITRFSVEEEFAANRQKFLIEQGYSYRTEER